MPSTKCTHKAAAGVAVGLLRVTGGGTAARLEVGAEVGTTSCRGTVGATEGLGFGTTGFATGGLPGLFDVVAKFCELPAEGCRGCSSRLGRIWRRRRLVLAGW